MNKQPSIFNSTIQSQLDVNRESIERVSDVRKRLQSESPETLQNILVFYRAKAKHLSIDNSNVFALFASAIAIFALLDDVINLPLVTLLLFGSAIVVMIFLLLKHHRNTVRNTEIASSLCMIAEELLKEKDKNRK